MIEAVSWYWPSKRVTAKQRLTPGCEERAGRITGFAGSDKSIRDVPYGFIGRKAPFSNE